MANDFQQREIGVKKPLKPLSGPGIVTSATAMEYGKLPPQAVEVEELVLGALMLEKNAVNTAIEILQASMFYKDSHAKIFQAIYDLFNNSEPIDIITVTNKLRSNGHLELVGGPYYITQLTSKITSAANIEFHSRIISQKFIQRELIRISTETVKYAFEDTTDVFVLLDTAEKNLFKIAEDYLHRSATDMGKIVKDAIKNIEEAAKKDGNVSGVPSGFYDIDNITAGWQKSDLIILAARPGMGKTAFALTVARNIAVDHKKGVAVFSLEMSATQLVTRLISAEAEIDASKLKKGELSKAEWDKMITASGKLSTAPLYIDDTPALSIFELRAKCRRLKDNYNIELIVIDYLQLMTGPQEKGGNREQEISTISRSLKALAKELNVPIITLSQLNRSVETRGGIKKPQLSDLRESGAIEQDADMVCFIYRPDYYGIEKQEEGQGENYAELVIAKHRNGALEDVKIQFIKRFAKFANYQDKFDFSEAMTGEIVRNQNPNAGMNPNQAFESGGITIPSSMNKDAVALPKETERDFDESHFPLKENEPF
ncbi:MAG: replicative DNA helicase [Bacteroidales bacterium]|nr:replicative DNA helicase [Bacteroidales bacterium]